MHLVQQQSRRTGSLQTYSGSKETSTMEELKKELEKLSKAYVDTPENEEKILIPFVKRLLELPMKERRKLLPVIRDLQWIKSKFAGFSSETTCSAARAHFLSAVQFVCANKREMDKIGRAHV